jgi:hypothetical protein
VYIVAGLQVADIDIDAGVPLQNTGKPVSIKFDKVRFSYQMRPDWEVLRYTSNCAHCMHTVYNMHKGLISDALHSMLSCLLEL